MDRVMILIQSQLTMTLHDAQELDDDFGRGSDEHLALTPTFGVDDVVLLGV
jgi:hypothetical protein